MVRHIGIVCVVVFGIFLGTSCTKEVPVDPTVQEVEQIFPGFTTDTTKYSVPLEEIVEGGPGKDGIPALVYPDFIPGEDAKVGEEVLGIVVAEGEEVKFYPYTLLVWHEVINDRIGDKEILVTFCPLCGTAIVFDRTIEGKVMEFRVTGKLYESNLLMYDTETESFWSQAKNEAVVGAYTGTKLVLHDMSVLSFGAARKKFPNMRVLSEDTGYERDYSFYPYGQYNETEETLFPISVLSTRFPAKTIMYSFFVQGISVAFPREELKEGSIEENIEGVKLRIERTGEEIQVFADGKKLPGYHEMWFSWAIHHEKTGVVLDVSKDE